MYLSLVVENNTLCVCCGYKFYLEKMGATTYITIGLFGASYIVGVAMVTQLKKFFNKLFLPRRLW